MSWSVGAGPCAGHGRKKTSHLLTEITVKHTEDKVKNTYFEPKVIICQHAKRNFVSKNIHKNYNKQTAFLRHTTDKRNQNKILPSEKICKKRFHCCILGGRTALYHIISPLCDFCTNNKWEFLKNFTF